MTQRIEHGLLKPLRVVLVLAHLSLAACTSRSDVPLYEIIVPPAGSDDPSSFETGPKNGLHVRTPCGPIRIPPNSKVSVVAPRARATCTVRVEAGSARFQGEELTAGAERIVQFAKAVPNPN